MSRTSCECDAPVSDVPCAASNIASLASAVLRHALTTIWPKPYLIYLMFSTKLFHECRSMKVRAINYGRRNSVTVPDSWAAAPALVTPPTTRIWNKMNVSSVLQRFKHHQMLQVRFNIKLHRNSPSGRSPHRSPPCSCTAEKALILMRPSALANARIFIGQELQPTALANARFLIGHISADREPHFVISSSHRPPRKRI